MPGVNRAVPAVEAAQLEQDEYQQVFDDRGVLYNAAHVLCPDARQAEAAALLKWLQPQSGETIVVMGAGGGFDACSIRESVQREARIICVEPSHSFNKAIPDGLEVLTAPFDHVGLPDACADAIVNLATLHHVSHRQEAYREWDRMLKPGGRMVIGDVEAKSKNGAFLNEVVHAFNPRGHVGVFLQPGEITGALRELGYQDCQEKLEAYRWCFDSQERLNLFAMLLFGMTEASLQEVEAGLKHSLGIVAGIDGSVEIPWSLRFARAFKPSSST